VGTEEDILDLIRELPGEVNNAGTTTEFKFLTVGSVLWACRAFRMHKLKGIGCRTAEGLIARGYVEVDGKWISKVK